MSTASSAYLDALTVREGGIEGAEPTAEFLLSRLRRLADANCMFINESRSNYHAVFDHLSLNHPGTIHASGDGSLGWEGGAAVGAKLARPEKTVVALTDEGSCMVFAPSWAHWMAHRHNAPFVQIIFSNRGWRSPKLAARRDGYAARSDPFDASFDPTPDYVAIAAASGDVWGRQIRPRAEVDPALAEAFRVVGENRRSVVLDVRLAHH